MYSTSLVSTRVNSCQLAESSTLTVMIRSTVTLVLALLPPEWRVVLHAPHFMFAGLVSRALKVECSPRIRYARRCQ